MTVIKNDMVSSIVRFHIFILILFSGSGQVTFDNDNSFMMAVQAAFVDVITPKFRREVCIFALVYMSCPGRAEPNKKQLSSALEQHGSTYQSNLII